MPRAIFDNRGIHSVVPRNQKPVRFQAHGFVTAEAMLRDSSQLGLRRGLADLVGTGARTVASCVRDWALRRPLENVSVRGLPFGASNGFAFRGRRRTREETGDRTPRNLFGYRSTERQFSTEKRIFRVAVTSTVARVLIPTR
jgi:hypothetical protein